MAIYWPSSFGDTERGRNPATVTETFGLTRFLTGQFGTPDNYGTW